jgi:ribonuclease J
MKVCIHRGTQEVGGTCIEIESKGQRIVLDVGLPLEAANSPASLPSVHGFQERQESLLAVVISHPHLDHYGLAGYLPAGTPMIMGAATERILKASIPFTPTGLAFGNVRHLEPGKPLLVGPFAITPYLNDHSAYDAYSLLICADGQRLFYSGDFRGHGRKAALFEQFLKHAPSDVDVLLMEGTTIGRSGSESGPQTELELERCFLDHITASHGAVLVWTSGQNIDRLVTVFKACKQAGRQLILDMYTAEILRATGNARLPQASWDGIKVFLPASQKRQVVRGGQFALADQYRGSRIYPEQLAGAAGSSVMLFRPSMMGDLENADCLSGATLIYSLWPGYLERREVGEFREWLKKRKIAFVHCHTSGHASPRDLQRFAEAIAPKMLVPIHSFATERFGEYFNNVKLKEDGQWWEVRHD